MDKPTHKQVAVEAAKYAVREFKDAALNSWFTYEDELADLWLKDEKFRCAIDYVVPKVMSMMHYVPQMQHRIKERGGGTRGIAYVAGHIIGEWSQGHTTLDRELDSW